MDASALGPGDLVLVQSRGILSAVGRRIGGNPYDHVGVVVGGGQTVNIDKPRTRLLPAERLVRGELAPLVLLGLEQFAGARDALRALPLDWNALGCGTTNDFLVIRARRPDLLQAVD